MRSRLMNEKDSEEEITVQQRTPQQHLTTVAVSGSPLNGSRPSGTTTVATAGNEIRKNTRGINCLWKTRNSKN